MTVFNIYVVSYTEVMHTYIGSHMSLFCSHNTKEVSGVTIDLQQHFIRMTEGSDLVCIRQAV